MKFFLLHQLSLLLHSLQLVQNLVFVHEVETMVRIVKAQASLTFNFIDRHVQNIVLWVDFLHDALAVVGLDVVDITLVVLDHWELRHLVMLFLVFLLVITA